MRFEIAKSRSKKEPFFWRLVANNGQTLATSEILTKLAEGEHRLIDRENSVVSEGGFELPPIRYQQIAASPRFR
jgi:uncharacterized protein YegP (UPF0339 family)